MVNVQRLGFLDFVREHPESELALVNRGDGWVIRCDLAGANVGLASQRSGSDARMFKTLDSAYRELSGLLADANRPNAVVRVFG
jgi:hypothetical protein